MKKFLAFVFLFSMFSLVSLPVFAETNTTSGIAGATATTKVADVAAKIKCVGVAIATRETDLGVAVLKHTDAVKAAYATRVNELAGAYSNITTKTLQVGVKTAWADFNKSVKSAALAWRTSRNTAWATFRTAVKACKATSGMADSSNSSSEVSGQ